MGWSFMTVNVGGKRRGRGAEAVAAEEKKEEQSKINPSDYSCEVILEKTTIDKANDRKLPTDAFNVFYVVDGEERLDVTRSGKMVNVFDMYWLHPLYGLFHLLVQGNFVLLNLFRKPKNWS